MSEMRSQVKIDKKKFSFQFYYELVAESVTLKFKLSTDP